MGEGILPGFPTALWLLHNSFLRPFTRWLNVSSCLPLPSPLCCSSPPCTRPALPACWACSWC